MRSAPELSLQKAVVDFLNVALLPPAWFTHFPSGGGGAARGAKLKAMGLKAGVPDLLIVHDGRAYWVELKAKEGRVSLDQLATINALRSADADVGVAKSVMTVHGLLYRWKIPMRQVTL